MTKLLCLSDTHSKHTDKKFWDYTVNNPDKTDILVHAGDLTTLGKPGEIGSVAEWFDACSKNYKAIVFIAGNHDFLFENHKDIAKSYFKDIKNCYYLDNSEIIIDSIKFYGVPETIEFCNWAFNIPAINMYKYWNSIPKDTDVLITHQPPFGILDDIKDSMGQRSLGCPKLLETVQSIKPKAHIFGHIHRDDSLNRLESNGTQFINASILNNRYKFQNPPTIIEI